MKPNSVVFFGSFLHYSTKVAKALHESPLINLAAVVTTPPAPAGRQKVLNKTDTHLWADENNIPVFTPEDLFTTNPKQVFSSQNTNSYIRYTLENPPDFLVVAGYGKLLPNSWLSYPTISSINLHFSLLPDYRGANPAEWAIMLGETQTGVTMIAMEENFDTGKIITRKTYPLSEDATRETLYEPLYDLAAEIAVETLPSCQSVEFATPQEESKKPEAKRFSRADGFIEWEFIQNALDGKYPKDPLPLLSTKLKQIWQYLVDHPNESEGIITPEVFVERSVRALLGFPGVWTYLPTKDGKKRLKILSTKFDNGIFTLDQVQIEGKQPATFSEIKNQIKS